MKILRFLPIISFLFFSTGFAQTEQTIIDDDLQGSTLGTQVGGGFTSDGYQPGTGFNHILYNVPVQVTNGYVEFQMKGFSPSLIQDPEDPQNDADNGFIGMYDGRGISEPCAYFYDFRENYFRWNLHWRQSRDAFKSVVSCAAPTAARLNSTYAVFSDSEGRDWTSEPTGQGYSFNSSSWYTVRLEWKDKNFKVTVYGTTVWQPDNGTTVWQPDIAEVYDYAPKDFKIWLGCAPGHTDKYGNWVAGVVFRNFKLVSYGSVLSAPDAPDSLNANSISSTHVNISWTDNSDNEDGFKIERKTGSGGSWSEIATVAANTTSYQNTGLTPNTTYYYRVRANNSTGNSSYSNEANAATQDISPDSPSDLAAEVLSAKQIKISWSDNSTNEDGFIVERKTDGTSFLAVDSVSVNDTSYMDMDLEDTTSYTYRVKAFNSISESNYSNEANIVSLLLFISAPNSLISTVDGNIIQLGWDDNSSNEEGFVIQRKAGDISSAVSFSAIDTVEINETSFIDSSVADSSTYVYRIYAFSQDTISDFSNLTQVTFTITGIKSFAQIPNEIYLEQNYPNPFNPSTIIRYSIPNTTRGSVFTTLKVYNMLGNEVATLVNKEQPAGNYEVKFSSTERTSSLASGTYIYRLSIGAFVSVKKMMLLK